MPSTTPRRAGDARRSQQRSLLVYVGIGVLVVILAIVVAVLSTSESNDAVTVDELAGDPTIEGDALPTAPADPATDPSFGGAAPVITGEDFDGTTTTIGDAGEAELLMFVASWCPACQQELPEVVAWLDAGGLPDDVRLTTVVTGLDASRPNWPPDAWLEEEGYTGEVLVDDADGSVAQAYGLAATPYWVALDAEGEVVVRVAGVLGASQLSALADAAQAGA